MVLRRSGCWLLYPSDGRIRPYPIVLNRSILLIFDRKRELVFEAAGLMQDSYC